MRGETTVLDLRSIPLGNFVLSPQFNPVLSGIDRKRRIANDLRVFDNGVAAIPDQRNSRQVIVNHGRVLDVECRPVDENSTVAPKNLCERTREVRVSMVVAVWLTPSRKNTKSAGQTVRSIR